MTGGARPAQTGKVRAGLNVAAWTLGTPIGLDIGVNGMYIREIGGVGTAPVFA